MTSRSYRSAAGEVNLLVRSDGTLFMLDDQYTRAVMGGSGRRSMPTRAYYSQETNDRVVKQVTTGYGFEPRTIELQWTYQGNNRTTFLDFLDRFIEFIRPNGNYTYALRNVRPDGRTRQIDVRLTSDLFMDEFTLGSRGLDEALQFMADDPRWYNPTLISVAVNDALTSGFGFPVGFPVGFATGHLQENITYGGNAETHPILTLTGPFQAAAVYNNSIDQSIWITGALDAGDTLVIDLDPSATTARRQDGADYYLYLNDSNLPAFVLSPATSTVTGGINNISFYAESYTSATTLTVSYYERYLNL